MARNWRRLVWAAAIASAFAASIAMPASHAQTVAKTKKSPKQEPATAEDGQAPQKKKRQDPAEAQKQIDAAQKLLEAGKADAAAQALTAVLSAGNLPPGLMARALYYRGAAQRQLQKPALAISDLTSALWLKGGLSDADRSEALKLRSAAYAEAGLADPGAPVAATPRAGSGVRTASVGEVSSTPPAPSSSWNIFGGLFGSPAAPAAQPEPPPPPKVAAVKPAPMTASWSSATEVKPSAEAPVGSLQPVAAAAASGKFRVQLALVRSESEASSIAARVRGEFASVFGPREASVEEAVVGNMGTMYRVRVGPYANAGEGQAACAKLKGSGLDCLVVTQ